MTNILNNNELMFRLMQEAIKESSQEIYEHLKSGKLLSEFGIEIPADAEKTAQDAMEKSLKPFHKKPEMKDDEQQQQAGVVQPQVQGQQPVQVGPVTQMQPQKEEEEEDPFAQAKAQNNPSTTDANADKQSAPADTSQQPSSPEQPQESPPEPPAGQPPAAPQDNAEQSQQTPPPDDKGQSKSAGMLNRQSTADISQISDATVDQLKDIINRLRASRSTKDQAASNSLNQWWNSMDSATRLGIIKGLNGMVDVLGAGTSGASATKPGDPPNIVKMTSTVSPKGSEGNQVSPAPEAPKPGKSNTEPSGDDTTPIKVETVY